MFEVEFYEKESGECPIQDFINELPLKLQAKLLVDLKKLQLNGSLLREPLSKFLEDGIFELRTKLATNIIRTLYFFEIDKKIIITNGFKKKTQKTPKKQIEIAKEYRKDYFRQAKKKEEDSTK